MSKKIYIGVNGAAKEVDPLYVSVGGSTKKISKVYVGVDGVAKQAYPETVTHKWNRYNVNTTYYWDRYNVNITYRWTRRYIKPAYEGRGYTYTYGGIATTTSNGAKVAKRRLFGVSNGEFQVYFDNVVSLDSIRNSPGTYYAVSVTNSNTWGRKYIKDAFVGEGPVDTSRFDGSFIGDLYHWGGRDYIEIVVSSSSISVTKIEYSGNYSLGADAGTVTSTNSNEYPSGSCPESGSSLYWYSGPAYIYSRGSYIGEINSSNSSQYPDDGRSGNYWYVYDRSTKTQGSSNGSVTSTNRSQYPDNGISGSYWYVYAGTV